MMLDINQNAKALIFDLDGTLADTMSVHFEAYRGILKEFGIDFTPKMLASMAGIPAIQTIEILNKEFGTNMDPEKIGFQKEREYEKMLNKITPIEPVVSVVKKYYRKLPMAIGTGGYREIAWKTLRTVNLDKYFDILVSSNDVEKPKPNPETFLKCAELMGMNPADCQVFEDSALGIKAARDAGMMYTLVTEYYNDECYV